MFARLTDEHLQRMRREAVSDGNAALVELADNAAFTSLPAYRLAACEAIVIMWGEVLQP